MPAIHFRTTVDAEPERVYDASRPRRASPATGPTSSRCPGKRAPSPAWASALTGPRRWRCASTSSSRPGACRWTPVGGFHGWIGTSITWRLEPADGGRTVVNFEHGGWPKQAADGEMAMCGYTWAMIIDRLGH
jgi:hypothetical protein